MKLTRTIKLVIILFSLVLIRTLVFPEITSYIELKDEKENYKEFLEEIKEENKNIKKLEIEVRELKSKVREIQNLSLPDFEILSAEKKSEISECIQESLCFLKKSYEINFSVSFDELVSFFKNLHDSKSLCNINKVEIKRKDKRPETKIILECWESEDQKNLQKIENETQDT